MKRLITILLMSLFLLPYIGFSAKYSPFPIVFKVKGLTVPVDIKVTNLRTGVSVTKSTNEYDECTIDWANTPDNGGLILKYQYGDKFEAKIPICEDSDLCVKSFTYNGGGHLSEFDLSSIQYTDCTLDCDNLDDLCSEELKEYSELMMPEYLNEGKCEDLCFEYFDCSLCDSPTCEPCDSCCEPCPECDETNLLDNIGILVGAILGLFGLGLTSGVVGYKFTIREDKRTGKKKLQITQHKHKVSPKGRARLHGVHIKHEHPNFKHPTNKQNALVYPTHIYDPSSIEGWGTKDNKYKDL